MKRTINFLLALAMILSLVLSACGVQGIEPPAPEAPEADAPEADAPEADAPEGDAPDHDRQLRPEELAGQDAQRDPQAGEADRPEARRAAAQAEEEAEEGHDHLGLDRDSAVDARDIAQEIAPVVPPV